MLAGRQIVLPDTFDRKSIKVAEVLAAAGDERLAHALPHVGDGRVAQFLAGVPELLRRYRTASPPARALLHAAMDARRLGVGLHVPLAFLAEAAEDYLTDDERDALDDPWFEQALDDTGEPVHGNLAPLRRVRPRTVREDPDGKGGGRPRTNTSATPTSFASWSGPPATGTVPFGPADCWPRPSKRAARNP
ncbi:hypothetical protein [Streptomyces sp. IBSBF 3136]|uniref:hypothetical protein n=1 Tax=Streptomyces sp. IBSBF 3136 TaxID=2903524 RepID=UPI002FDC63EE